jgi:hypothetical protein
MRRVDRLFARGTDHLDRWQATRSAVDLGISIAAFTKLESILPASDPRRMAVDRQLGVALVSRAELEQSVAGLDSAIILLRRALSEPEAAANADFDSCHLVLGKALANRIGAYGGADRPSDGEFLDQLRTAVDSLTVAARSQSEHVPPAERAAAATMRGHLMPSLVITWAMGVRNADGQVDCAELERALGDLSVDHLDRPQLTLELGRAHLYQYFSDILFSPASPFSDDHFSPGPSPGNFSSAHREPAIRHLSEAMDALGLGEPLLPVALAYVIVYHAGSVGMKANDVLDHRTRDLVTRLLAHPGLNAEAAASLHVIMALDVASGTVDSLAAAIDHLNQAQRLAPGFEPVQSGVTAVFSEVLSTPMEMAGSLDDRDAADASQRRILRELEERGEREQPAAWYEQGGPRAQVTAMFSHPVMRQGQRARDEVSAAFRAGDLARVDLALGRLDQYLRALPAEHEVRWAIELFIGEGWRIRGELSGDQQDVVRGLRAQLSAFELAEAGPVARLVILNGRARRLKACRAIGLAWLTRDTQALSAALGQMPSLGDDPSMTPAEQADWAWKYGAALIAHHEIAGQPSDLDDGIARLEQATRQAHQLDIGSAGHGPAQSLADAYWRRGDRSRRDPERAIDTGILALRRRAEAALLQSGAGQGLRLTRWHGLTQAVELVNWCLAEGRPGQAVEALELGRAVVLHTATVAADIPALLTAAGEEVLAIEWRTAAGRGIPAPGNALSPLLAETSDVPGGGPLELPSALRRRVLGALRVTRAGRPLLAAPGLPELAEALRRAGTDAFVYLIPPSAGNDGRALLLSAQGSLEQLSLPGLGGTGPLDSYESAAQEAAKSGWDNLLAWHRALDTLCGWAWTAAVRPLLDHAARWKLNRPPRLVIIPVGRLSLVPWHAARTTRPDGRWHYALQDAVFCYAASAGQFTRAAARPARLPSAAPVLVSNPTGDLDMAQLEVTELLRRYYPGAAYLGQPEELATGPATPAGVLCRLPGGSLPLASLLHCGCHASVAESLAESYLLLSGDQQLRVADILGQAQRHDQASPGFLAVLSACMTDLANRDYDEALTLASALLAAGACGVVGARWPVPDRATAPFMVMFHHFINGGHPHPADALRAAQLWMLDTARPVPDGLPESLNHAANHPSLARPYSWAAFTYQGAHTDVRL